MLPRTLGIETSCDETAVAVLDAEGRVEFNCLSSQVAEHAPFGGVVPELASREHLKALPMLVERALEGAGGSPELVAVTAGPGLVGALLVGVRFAGAFAWGRELPLVAVDHLDGHQVSPFLDLEGGPARELPERVLALVASGGHSAWYSTESGETRRLCRTRDDAAGETFDKVAKVFGLAYPGGPVVDRLARRGSAAAAFFRQPRLKDGSNDFSFSGLKSAAIREIRARGLEGVGEHDAGSDALDLLASFESAVVRQLLGPLPDFFAKYQPQVITASGGVAANTLLRECLAEEGRRFGVEVILPPLGLTTDNAAMIARAGQLAWAGGRCADARRLDAWTRKVWHPPGMRRSPTEVGSENAGECS
ncbi:MAG: tRNA (adenosine(37)-N6)-threonylcarbamoyltransferase complex transferase subunit TsaD [Thermoanaerobaculales bacterium]|nr:tRNA (adenosine(37)-N6)-threonylcarbamoyltransferase complex transferase subunit TsaD [Thermoanaerobaculales bacterium]